MHVHVSWIWSDKPGQIHCIIIWCTCQKLQTTWKMQITSVFFLYILTVWNHTHVHSIPRQNYKKIYMYRNKTCLLCILVIQPLSFSIFSRDRHNHGAHIDVRHKCDLRANGSGVAITGEVSMAASHNIHLSHKLLSKFLLCIWNTQFCVTALSNNK